MTDSFELRPPQIVTPEGVTVDDTVIEPITPHYQDGGVTLFHGDCLDVLRELADESVHAVVTDPPYGLSNTDPGHVTEAITHWTTGDRAFLPSAGGGFMGKAWDEFVPPPAVWDECMRVLKPGGHLLAFAGSRTVDLMALSIRLAGFDIRDSIAWLYSSGFPKSLDVAKAIDKTAGFVGEVLRTQTVDIGMQGGNMHTGRDRELAEREVRALSPEAELWSGWGTALKPAFEPIVVARKPLAGTVAANVLAHGTGALNIDASRIPGEPVAAHGQTDGEKVALGRGWQGYAPGDAAATPLNTSGRWPANVVLDESQAAVLDDQAPDTGGSGRSSGPSLYGATDSSAAYGARAGVADGYEPRFYGGERGGASRMFPTFRYEAKAPTAERPVVDGVAHPTVKPLELMQWLVRLVTPKGGTVLEPFAGSGTTVEACLREGFDCIAIEREADYLPLIEKRIRKDHSQGLDFDWGEAL